MVGAHDTLSHPCVKAPSCHHSTAPPSSCRESLGLGAEEAGSKKTPEISPLKDRIIPGLQECRGVEGEEGTRRGSGSSPAGLPHRNLLGSGQWAEALTPTDAQLWVLTSAPSEGKAKVLKAKLGLVFSMSRAKSLMLCTHRGEASFGKHKSLACLALEFMK